MHALPTNWDKKRQAELRHITAGEQHVEDILAYCSFTRTNDSLLFIVVLGAEMTQLQFASVMIRHARAGGNATGFSSRLG